MKGFYANKDHIHKPDKGMGSYDRKKENQIVHEDWTWEEEEAFREIERQQKEDSDEH